MSSRRSFIKKSVLTASIPVFAPNTELFSILKGAPSDQLNIGVIGTKATIQSNVYEHKIIKLCNSSKVSSLATPLLAPMIEEGFINEDISHTVIANYLSNKKLANIDVAKDDNFKSYIKRKALGVVFVIAPWNYPYLVAVNSIIPAMAAGNSVILKHSAQTPLCSEQLYQSAKKILPNDIFNYLHLNHEDSLKIVSDKRINFVSFTGSVKAGYDVQRATQNKFIDMTLELGGKDPAYARYDCDLEKTVENLVDGSFFNSGQSCCGIERIYVDEKIYNNFLELFVSKTYNYKLGNPLEKKTNLGPVVKLSAADFILQQMNSAINKGAKKMIDENKFTFPKEHKNYLIPQVLTNVTHEMSFMTEETFGPCVGIMKVRDENEAIKLMNDSPYGLTASIWTKDIEIAEKIGNKVKTGTFYMNRCDYLDPALSWTGVKETGKGCSLSEVAYEKLTSPKSFHLRKEQ